MLGCGKKTAWSVWEAMPALTATLLTIMEDPTSLTLDSDHMKQLEGFVVLMFSKSCSAATVNEARFKLFSRGLRALDTIPPSQAALFQHIKRSILQAAFIWQQSMTTQQTLPAFDEWGWNMDVEQKQWVPYWTTLGDASKACAVLLHCKCTRACRGNCKCSRAGLRCTSLCTCEGGCSNTEQLT